MKINKLRIKNFRGYKDEVTINFSNLTAIVGKNDVGKSSVLEALDIFFNDGKGLIKLDQDDINKTNKELGYNDVVISVSFVDLPDSIVIDDSNVTTLKDEYLLNEQGELEIIKMYKNASTTSSNLIVSINAYHPSNVNCANLLQKKQKDLQAMVSQLGITDIDDKRKNASMRSAIWKRYESEGGLALKETEINVNSKDGDIKAIWDQLKSYMPVYSLFQSDRKNSDTDNEVQDPLKEAVKEIISSKDIQSDLDDIAEQVRKKLQEVSDNTLSKIKEMDESVASTLHPKIPDTSELKWSDVFKGLSITGDDDIPINKRGSGVRRLILLNFFRAEAESKLHENTSHIIYAIEEPETSQHKSHQIMLIKALKELSNNGKTQVIITTHSSDIVKQLSFDQIILLYEESGIHKIKNIDKNTLPYPSLNEINYQAFDDVSEEYHNELYGYLQAKAIDENNQNETEKNFDAWLITNGCNKSKNWTRLKNGNVSSTTPCTLQTYIRNYIHHPENSNNNKYSIDDLRSSIEEMRKIASKYLIS